MVVVGTADRLPAEAARAAIERGVAVLRDSVEGQKALQERRARNTHWPVKVEDCEYIGDPLGLQKSWEDTRRQTIEAQEAARATA